MRVFRAVQGMLVAGVTLAALPSLAAGQATAAPAAPSASPDASPPAPSASPAAAPAAPAPSTAPETAPAASATPESAPAPSSTVAYELQRPPRPPPPPEAPHPRVPWQRHLEVGGDAVFAFRPVQTTGTDRGIRYDPTLGFGLHARFPIVRWLEFTTYFYDADHDVDVPNGALGPEGTAKLKPVETFAFGARLSPTLHFGDRFRVWLTGGVGWGRMDFGRMTIEQSDGSVVVIRERSNPYVEFPIGVGAGFELIKDWLVLEYEATGAFVANESSTAVSPFQGWQQRQEGSPPQTVGHLVTIEPFPGFGSTWLQTLGLSLIL